MFVRVSFNVFVCHVCDLLSDDVWHVFVVLNCLCLCVFVMYCVLVYGASVRVLFVLCLCVFMCLCVACVIYCVMRYGMLFVLCCDCVCLVVASFVCGLLCDAVLFVF